jgi:hypothetical protein
MVDSTVAPKRLMTPTRVLVRWLMIQLNLQPAHQFLAPLDSLKMDTTVVVATRVRPTDPLLVNEVR